MDVPTLYLTASLILISLPVALWGVVGPKQRRQPIVVFWCAGGPVVGLGVGLFGFRSVAPDLFTISLAFALVDFGLLLRWQALRGLLNQPPLPWLSLIALTASFFLAFEWARSTGVIAWPLIVYPIQLALGGVLVRDCFRIIREQHSVAARWLLVSYLPPFASTAIQLLIFLTNLESPIGIYPAQMTPITGLTVLFLAVISNFSFLGILSERKASEEAKEIKRVEREALLREFSARLSRADRMRSLGALAGALAHELAQPLTVILSNAELAKSSLSRGGVSVEQQAELMQSILRNAKRGNAIVQSIRQRLQPVDRHLDRVDLISITAEVIELMVPLLEAHQVELVQRMQDTPLTVSGDSTELSQVVVILLTNAVEASAASAVRRIEITVQAKGEQASLSVRDQGHGLSDEALTSAGDALFTTKPGGLGLGLEIAMTIVRQHYGTLMLANAPGGGAIAVVDLPQAVPANPFGA